MCIVFLNYLHSLGRIGAYCVNFGVYNSTKLNNKLLKPRKINRYYLPFS